MDRRWCALGLRLGPREPDAQKPRKRFTGGGFLRGGFCYTDFILCLPRPRRAVGGFRARARPPGLRNAKYQRLALGSRTSAKLGSHCLAAGLTADPPRYLWCHGSLRIQFSLHLFHICSTAFQMDFQSKFNNALATKLQNHKAFLLCSKRRICGS